MHSAFLSILASALSGLALVGCNLNAQVDLPPRPATEDTKSELKDPRMTEQVNIKVGEKGANFLKRHPNLVKTWQSLPGVVQDYRVSWDVNSRGSVRLDHGVHSVTIEHVLTLLSSQDLKERAADGLDEVNITAGLRAPAGVDHDEARLKTFEILRRIEAVGWKTITPRSRPRLTGRERLAYAIDESGSIGMDTKEIPTLEQWMRIEDLAPWRFYADRLYLEVSFRRSSAHMDLKQPGIYQLSFNIKTDTEYFRGFAGPHNRHRWKEVVPAELVKLAKVRAQKEAELKAKGFAIDESYQDPPVVKFD